MASGGLVVGARVVLRHRVPGLGPSGGPALNDVVGRLLEADGAELVVERRDGTLARVPRGDVVAAKVVPDRPLRSRRPLDVAADDLERITSRGWPPVVGEPLGEWELRASGGFTGRANSALAVGDPGVPTAEAVERVLAFAAAQGVAPMAQVVVGSPQDEALRRHGWTPVEGARPGALVQVARVEPGHRADPDAVVLDHADDAWLSRYGRVDTRAPDKGATARAVLEGPSRVGFVSLGPAIGRVVVTGEWAGLACVEVDPGERRRGWARRVVETSLAWAHDHGADKAYLQTMRDNTAALALYEPFGFVTHHEYRYLVPAAG